MLDVATIIMEIRKHWWKLFFKSHITILHWIDSPKPAFYVGNLYLVQLWSRHLFICIRKETWPMESSVLVISRVLVVVQWYKCHLSEVPIICPLPVFVVYWQHCQQHVTMYCFAVVSVYPLWLSADNESWILNHMIIYSAGWPRLLLGVSRLAERRVLLCVSPRERMPGYGATAVDKKLGLVCPHCKLLLRSAVQTAEGVRLCESCFKEIARWVCMDVYVVYVQRDITGLIYCYILVHIAHSAGPAASATLQLRF